MTETPLLPAFEHEVPRVSLEEVDRLPKPVTAAVATPGRSSSSIPAIWYGFLQFFCLLTFFLALGYLIGGAKALASPEYGASAGNVAAFIFGCFVTLGLGIASPLSLTFATSDSVKKWTIGLWALFAIDIIFIIIFLATHMVAVVSALEIAVAVSYLIYTAVFTPLAILKKKF